MFMLTSSFGMLASPIGVVANETVRFSLYLARQQPEALAEAVRSVSSPDSPQFRKYMSDDEIAALLRPTDLPVVEAWVKHGAPTASLTRRAHGSGQVLDVSAPADEVTALLGVPLARFGRLVRAAQQGSPPPPLPASVAPHVAAVLGVYDLPLAATTRPTGKPRPEVVEATGQCYFKGEIIDPNVLAKQYGWPSAKVGSGRVSQGVAAFEDAEFKPSDVAAFEAAYSLPNVSFSIQGPNDGGFFGEAGLDTQYIAASGAGLPSWFLSQVALPSRPHAHPL